MHPKRSQVASIVPPRATEMKVLEPRARIRLKRLALDCALAAAFSSSETYALKKGIVISTVDVVRKLPSASVNNSGLLKVGDNFLYEILNPLPTLMFTCKI